LDPVVLGKKQNLFRVPRDLFGEEFFYSPGGVENKPKKIFKYSKKKET
jgi:hypothetical protein